ncbi:hypothetical protein BC455_18670 [Vibrio harveyi]|nr:hypothetical protein BC455_18670 [Vibrio harveyi]
MLIFDTLLRSYTSNIYQYGNLVGALVTVFLFGFVLMTVPSILVPNFKLPFKVIAKLRTTHIIGIGTIVAIAVLYYVESVMYSVLV